jgi:hypothetical protein
MKYLIVSVILLVSFGCGRLPNEERLHPKFHSGECVVFKVERSRKAIIIEQGSVPWQSTKNWLVQYYNNGQPYEIWVHEATIEAAP